MSSNIICCKVSYKSCEIDFRNEMAQRHTKVARKQEKIDLSMRSCHKYANWILFFSFICKVELRILF